MITISLRQLVQLSESRLLNKFFALDPPVAVAWTNRKQPTFINEVLKSYDEQRLALCQRFGVKNPTTGNYHFDVALEDVEKQPLNTPPGPNRLAFNAALDELLNQVVSDIPGNPVKVSELSGHLNTLECVALEPFLTD